MHGVHMQGLWVGPAGNGSCPLTFPRAWGLDARVAEKCSRWLEAVFPLRLYYGSRRRMRVAAASATALFSC